MKKIYYVSIVLIVLIVSFLGITYSFEYQDDKTVSFNIIGPSPLYMNVGSEYVEYGITAMQSGIDISNKIKIDSSQVNMHELGEYKVKYEYNGEYVYREVVVFDKEKPVINLIGGNEINILLNGAYNENGYTVTDNYDTDLEKNVKVSGNVNTNEVGEYTIHYSVVDGSGNVGEATRKVIVKKPEITVSNDEGNHIYSPTSYNVTQYSNTIVKNNFYKYGVYYEGYVNQSSKYYKIKLKNRKNKLEYVYNMGVTRDKYYSGNLNLTTVENGTYDLYIVANSEERLLNKLNFFSKIVRAKVGNKLVTFIYDDDNVSIQVEDFVYQYDVVIDPGHGGSDTGTANGIVIEKDLNLKISKYEKCRYESMGYRVYMLRYNDTYGEMLGGTNLDPLDRRSLAIGYYGAISRVVYSNHHNGSYDSLEGGFEILVSSHLAANELEPELNLYKRYLQLYNTNDDKIHVYAKDYDTEEILDKTNGAVYGNVDYYSAIRIPYELYNVKSVIYEPIFMTNPNDFNWYYANNNWIKVSEYKIEEYVKYMGGVYDSNNKKCL